MSDVNKLVGICEKIWRFEEQAGVFSDEKYCPAWMMVRLKIYYNCMEMSGLFRKAEHADGVISLVKRAMFSLVNLPLTIVSFIAAYKTTVVVFEHPRTLDENGVAIDSNSYYLISQLLKKNTKLLVFSRRGLSRRKKTDGFKRIDIDFFEISRVLFAYLAYSLRINSSSLIIERCRDVLGAEPAKILCRARLEFIFSSFVYSVVFSLMPSLKTIYLVDGYSSRAGIIAAAKKKNIKVCELQHGIISSYHLGYSFPYKSNIDYMPDEIFVWDQFWKSNLIQISPIKVSINIYNRLNAVRSLYTRPKIQRSVVVISQPAISTELADIIWKHRRQFENWHVFYKLHPDENGTSPEIMRFSHLTNFSVEREKDLYQLLSTCEFQIGVFSTAIFEGLAFDCKPVIVPLPGSEYMSQLDVNIEDFGSWVARLD